LVRVVAIGPADSGSQLMTSEEAVPDVARNPRARARVLAGVPAVSTLRAAHEFMRTRWPGRDARLAQWLAYHQVGAALYAEIAELDRFHHHEALHWAARERESVEQLAAQIRIAGTGPDRAANQ
jgi:hypothetical protein